MQNAAIRLLGMPRSEIAKRSEDIIFGQLRQVIASMQIEDINRDREKFLEAIQNSLEPELRKIGLVLINVNITDITDESGYIEAIGRKAASQAIQKARGDVADNEKMGEIRVADAEREKAVPGGQRPQAPRDRHARGHARAGRAHCRARQGAAGGRAVGRVSEAGPGEGRRAGDAHQDWPTPRPGRSRERTWPRPTWPPRRRACR